MTSPPPPPSEPAWNFQRPEHSAEPNDVGSARAPKPKHTALLLSVGIVVGLIGVTGASAAVLKATTGSYLPASGPSATADPAASKDPAPAEPTEVPTAPAQATEPTELPLDQVLRQQPEQVWKLTGADLPGGKGNTLQLPGSNPQGTPNTSEVLALVSTPDDADGNSSVLGVNLTDGSVEWTYTAADGVGNCYTLGAGEALGCINPSGSDSSDLLFLDVETGAVLTETSWDHRALLLSGTPENLFIGGLVDDVPYLANGTATSPGKNWLTQSEVDEVPATGIYHLGLNFDVQFAQFSINEEALVVEAPSGAIIADIPTGFANVIPGIGAYSSQGMAETVVQGAFEAPGHPWTVTQNDLGIRPALGIGDTLFDARTGAPLWSIPVDESEAVHSSRTFQLSNQVLRVGDTDRNSIVTAFDIRTGSQLWQKTDLAPYFTVTDSWGDVAVVLTYAGHTPVALEGFDAARGEYLWQVPIDYPNSDNSHAMQEFHQILGSTIVTLGSNELVGYAAQP